MTTQATPQTTGVPGDATDDSVTNGGPADRSGSERAAGDPVEALLDRLASLPSLMVAFSGGADSAFLLAAAVRALGPDRVEAATAVSPSLPRSELDRAREFTAGLGVAHHAPATDELSREGYRANAGDRCFFCKTELMSVVGPLAAARGVAAVATGTNADDLRAGFRPGIRAAADAGAITPLADAGLTKTAIRAVSKAWGLSTWDKPAAACLASRIAYGVEVTADGLERVAAAERSLRRALAEAAIPVRNLRVRDLGDDTAKIEIDAELVAAVADRPGVLAAVEGFASVRLDERGFRSGAMNELLPDPERYR
ncbi:ATP-dependent sacrificial sulfur transferase LarE [Glycomyces sp. NRRL B-16210]|uniref:ATP-dependent sacrificial sulfur transferase LarE n=1 Tax=Glycomyces sp. NRRL B-16210 TaxID=1463821 RepID=UPI000B01C9DA|nr:ATP-dependent sacrificial sulfur transferase LarE [Glycomyces sp. NRRL B-16210]